MNQFCPPFVQFVKFNRNQIIYFDFFKNKRYYYYIKLIIDVILLSNVFMLIKDI